MEQAAGKAPPPPMAINSGGGILLNMNAVRAAAAVGATVVPSTNAQSSSVMGSPGGPPGKVVGPRMISISPQMLASAAAARPGQPGHVSFAILFDNFKYKNILQNINPVQNNRIFLDHCTTVTL